MGVTSTINEKWRFCIFACFVGSIILLSCLKPDEDGINLSASRNITITMTWSNDSNQPSSSGMQFLQLSNATEQRKNVNEKEESCNIFDGKWVYDPTSSPLYHGSQCPFLSEQVSCQRNGRPDSEYEKWSWEAKGCRIPSFNGTNMLERLKGKRVVIVGDSINGNQWESLVCLLHSTISSSRTHTDMNIHDNIFRAEEYNCSVEFYRSSFLVQLEGNKENGGRILRLDKLSDWEKKCRGADIMVFNTGHWWVHGGRLKRWDLFQYKGKVVEEMEVQSAFGMAMKTWARWIDRNVDKTKTKVFFRSFSPVHYGKQRCYNQTQPIMDESYVAKSPNPIVEVVERTIRRMRTPVRYLNITKLSQYRKDGHTTGFTIRQKTLPKAMKQSQRKFRGDCSHWCLPGVPDTWNRLLFASMVMDNSSDTS
ncbi:protein trichome birefringence-like 42 [Carya illinoinensis]|uniref:protein trichome birefringence-like 42 n=1 Tax=Carya illinoinensis TaxID=32201 RepID=UPI001C719481|nr:protein trichome birefringence-like 42 [Carya illinoinensis]